VEWWLLQAGKLVESVGIVDFEAALSVFFFFFFCRFGWFVPFPLAYLVPGIDHWRIFADENTASLFSMSGSIFSYVQSFTRLNAADK
jgi:hypothetical protein